MTFGGQLTVERFGGSEGSRGSPVSRSAGRPRPHLFATCVDEVAGDDVDLALFTLYRRVLELRVDGDAEVGGQRPRRRRPDEEEDLARVVLVAEDLALEDLGLDRVLRERELDVDGRARVLAVLDLGLGQSGLVVDAPVDGARALVDVAALDEAAELPRRLRLVVVRHRQVRVVPQAEDAEALEVARLPLQGLGGVLAADAPEARHGEVGAVLALLLERALDVLLDGQAVAVVAGDVGAVVAQHRARLDDDVFQNLVHRRAEVDVGVGVGRPVVEDEALAPRAGAADQLVEPHLGPALQTRGLRLPEVGLLREARLRQVDCLLQLKRCLC